MFLLTLGWVRAWLAIVSPSKMFETAGRDDFWAGWDRADAEIQWKKRHRLERIRAARQKERARVRDEIRIQSIATELNAMVGKWVSPVWTASVRAQVRASVREAYELGKASATAGVKDIT